MPVWAVNNVQRQPSVSLLEWQVMQVENGDHHFVGYCPENREGRVSSAVVTFDVQKLRGVTRSGRVYQLVGRPGLNVDAEYIWQVWADINEVKTWKDVAAELVLPGSSSEP